MNDLDRLFKKAERLNPPAHMWDMIEVQSGLNSSARPVRLWWEMPVYRLAASVAVVAGLLGTVFVLQHHGPLHTKPAVEGEVVDAELLTWDADLGEWDGQSDEESKLADKIFEKTEEGGAL